MLSTVALFMFFVTIIGGNSPLLIPFARSFLSVKPKDVDVYFSAQSADATSPPYVVEEAVSIASSAELQYALVWVLDALYAGAAIGFVAAAYYLWDRAGNERVAIQKQQR